MSSLLDLPSSGLPLATEAGPSTGGRLIYAVGDIHGNLDLLEVLAESITQDALLSGPAERPMLIFLGDYVDRGPDSRGVIEFILELQAAATFELRTIKGNHEEAVLSFLASAEFGPVWMSHGGGATLASYGVTAPSTINLAAWQATRDAFDEALPASHLGFMQALELLITAGDYAFVHAGLRPGVALDKQCGHDLMWIRHEFLEANRAHEKVVVHGHTPSEAPHISAHRLGIDTGAYATGVLTAVRLENQDRRLIQARLARIKAAP